MSAARAQRNANRLFFVAVHLVHAVPHIPQRNAPLFGMSMFSVRATSAATSQQVPLQLGKADAGTTSNLNTERRGHLKGKGLAT